VSLRFCCAPVALTIGLSLIGCDKPAPPPTPIPEAKTSASVATVSSAAPSASAVTSAAPEPVESASAVASADAPAPSGSAKVASAEAPLPRAPHGILPTGAADKILAVGAAPIVRVIDAGEEPREALVYTLKKGQKSALRMDMDTAMAMKISGQDSPEATLPRVWMVLDVTSADVNATGDTKIDAKLAKTGVEARGKDAQQTQLAEQMRGPIDAMKGLGIGYWVSPKGYAHDVKLDLPATFPEGAQQMLQGMNQSFESMVLPLPKEAVGKGAKWQVITRVNSGGADILQYATYTMKSHEGTSVAVDIALTQLAANELVKGPQNVTAHLHSFQSNGTGKSSLDLTTVAPKDGSMRMRSALDLGLEGAAGKDDTQVKTTLTVTFSRPKS
jgi:hypothetical protein